MKTATKLLLALLLSAACTLPMGAKALKDYSHIRGTCYTGWQQDEQTIRKELGYGVRMGMNSTRIWLTYNQYKRDPQTFLTRLRNYIRIAHSMDITVMPIIWNGNGLNPDILKESFWEQEGDKYVTDLVNAMKAEPGIIAWDIMNEPTCNDYHNAAPSDEVRAERKDEIFRFVRHYCQLVKKLDKENPITVGVTFPANLEAASPDLVDILSFHDYLETKARVENSYRIAEEVAAKYHKPLINSELGCTGRSNPYDLAISKSLEHNVGFYAFELMIHGNWAQIHGFFYPDGTVRDPAAVAAFMGFYRNRNQETMIKEKPNRENKADAAIRAARRALTEQIDTFNAKDGSTDALLEAAEYCANILEGNQMIPMWELPTAQIETWRKQPAAERDYWAIRAFLYDLVQKLKDGCQIID